MTKRHGVVVLNNLIKSRPVLPIISVITFLGFLDTHLLIPVMALYASQLGASVGITGLVVGLYSITNTPANIFFGRWIDRIGYKIPLIVGLIGDALSMFLYSLCRLPVHLALVRAVHGTSGGLVGPATMSIIAGSKTRKGRAMAFYGISLAATTLIGYPVSGMVVTRLGYQTLFFIGTAVVIIGVLISLLLPGAPSKREAVKTDTGKGFAGILVLLKRQGLTTAYCSIFAQYFAFGGLVTLLPLYVKNLGMGAFHVGMILAVFAVTFIIVQVPVGNLSDRLGRLRPIAIGLVLAVISLLLLPFFGTFPLLAGGMALFGIAYGFLFPSISASIADYSSPEERGTATGVFHALLTAGVAIGAPVIGWLGGTIGVEKGLMSTAGIMILALIVALTSWRRFRI